MKGGIYGIRHIASGRTYVGSTAYFAQRFSQHRASLRTGRHCNARLQRAWVKYGPEAFEFAALETVADHSILDEREQWWIDHTPDTYNMAPVLGARRGWKHSAETLAKMSASQRGRKVEREACLPGVRAAAIANTGKPCKDSTRQKIADAARSRWARWQTHRTPLALARRRANQGIILRALGNGHLLQAAVQMAGVTKNAHYRWLDTDTDYAKDYAQLTASAASALIRHRPHARTSRTATALAGAA